MTAPGIKLHEMLADSLNYFCRNPEPKADYLPFFGGKIPEDGPARLERCCWDYGDGTGRFLEAAQLAKQSLGQTIPAEVELGLWKNLLDPIADDGLFYSPQTPWTKSDYGDVWYQRGVLMGLLARYAESADSQDLRIINRMVDALDELAIRENSDTYFYYSWNRSHEWNQDESLSPVFALSDVLTLCGELTGNEKALSLAGDLLRSMLDGKYRYFDDEGELYFPVSKKEIEEFKSQNVDFTLIDGKTVFESKSAWMVNNGHATSRSMALLGLIRYSLLTGNKELLDRGRVIYDKLVSKQCTCFGWAPENFLTAGRECSEMCTTTDLLLCQILLAKAGHHEYWEQCEKYLRNHIRQSQFFPNDVVREITERYHSMAAKASSDNSISYDHALDRMAGGFAGPIYPDDLFCYYPRSRYNRQATRTIDISGCCAPSGAKAIATSLLNVVQVAGTTCRVNLLMDYENDLMKISSSLPDTGQLTLSAKQELELSVRAPSWCKDAHDIKCTVDGSDKVVPLSRGNIHVGHLRPGSEIRLRFAVPERTETVVVGRVPYELAWRGYDIISLRNLTDYEPLMSRYQGS